MAWLERMVLPVIYKRNTKRSILFASVSSFSNFAALSSAPLSWVDFLAGFLADIDSVLPHPRPGCLVKLNSHDHLFSVGQVPNDSLDRLGKFSHESGNSDNLIALREVRMFHEVDHFDEIPAGQPFFTEALQVGESRDGARGLPGDIEPESPVFGQRSLAGLWRSGWSSPGFGNLLRT